MNESVVEASSFRDPAGFVFSRGGRLFRQVNRVCQADYDRCVGSGLFDALRDAGSLVGHEEVDAEPATERLAYKVIEPQRLPFVSYPYEWCFGQLKAAALRTLDVLRQALDRGMTLKDASAYNVQFVGCRAVFIDTLSFETYREGQPWAAYGQFCRHFLAPLALMSGVDVRLNGLLRQNLDGVPLDLASRLLPARTWLRPSHLIHLHLHARAARSYEARPAPTPAKTGTRGGFSKNAFLGLIEGLESAVRAMDWEPSGTEWADYYDDTNYTDAAADHKTRLIAQALDEVRPATVWDLGANTGKFSRLASDRGAVTLALDVDPAAVERNYRDAVRRGDSRMLPLCMDLTNPSPGLGWANRERPALADRGQADLVLALALIHHLTVGGNVPFARVAEYLSKLARNLVIEFVPKSDAQVSRLLVVREDVFADYTRENFEAAFGRYFTVDRVDPVEGTARSLYRMRSLGV